MEKDDEAGGDERMLRLRLQRDSWGPYLFGPPDAFGGTREAPSGCQSATLMHCFRHLARCVRQIASYTETMTNTVRRSP